MLLKEHLHKPSRRDLRLMAGALASGLSPAAASAQIIRRTPSQILGPFYPVQKPLDQDTDLTMIAGRSGRASGRLSR
jgi:protocatechuate 3,4-dioxygenase, beta subunit